MFAKNERKRKKEKRREGKKEKLLYEKKFTKKPKTYFNP